MFLLSLKAMLTTEIYPCCSLSHILCLGRADDLKASVKNSDIDALI